MTLAGMEGLGKPWFPGMRHNIFEIAIFTRAHTWATE
jgi:hypothetical protein